MTGFLSISIFVIDRYFSRVQIHHIFYKEYLGFAVNSLGLRLDQTFERLARHFGLFLEKDLGYFGLHSPYELRPRPYELLLDCGL